MAVDAQGRPIIRPRAMGNGNMGRINTGAFRQVPQTQSIADFDATVVPTTIAVERITVCDFGASLGAYVDIVGNVNGLPTSFRVGTQFIRMDLSQCLTWAEAKAKELGFVLTALTEERNSNRTGDGYIRHVYGVPVQR